MEIHTGEPALDGQSPRSTIRGIQGWRYTDRRGRRPQGTAGSALLIWGLEADCSRLTFRGTESAPGLHARLAMEYAEDGGLDPRSCRVDFGKLARACPDFTTKWTAADGARELRAAFEQVALTAEAFQGDKYTRLARLRLLAAEGVSTATCAGWTHHESPPAELPA
jgi:hypothetical protein